MPRKPFFEIDKRSVRRLQRQFRQLQKSADKEISKEIDSIMGDVLNDAKSETPVDTARLRDSGRREKTKSGSTKKWEVKFGGVSVRGKFVDYAIPVHETQKPFLVEPFDRAKPRILKDLHRKMDKLLRSASKLK